MALDPLAQYRRNSSLPIGPTILPVQDEEYTAFAAKDSVVRLRIRSRMSPVNSPGYNILLNLVYDAEGTNFLLVFSMLSVFVRGRNLQRLVYAIENGQADFIQEFDPKKWRQPNDPAAPFIESIQMTMAQETDEPKAMRH